MALLSIRVFLVLFWRDENHLINMNPFITILVFLINTFHLSLNSYDYKPLYCSTLKTLIITNPCHTDQSILIRNHSLYKFDRKQSQWKQLYISNKLFPNEVFKSLHQNFKDAFLFLDFNS